MTKNMLHACFVAFFVTISLYSQTEAERKKISSTYDMDKIEQLKAALAEKNRLKELRILKYLESHPNQSRSTKINGKTFAINDIVDGKPIYRTTHNSLSARATKTDQLYSGGSLGINVEGENMSIGVWDEESALGTHVEFEDDQVVPQSRVIYPEFNGNPFIGTTSDHATHVAGTLIAKGVDPDAKGMAPKATLRSFDWNGDENEAIDEAANGLLISNHSYGVPIFNNGGTQQVTAQNIGAYSSDARTWDDIAFNAPYYLAVNSAGNEGGLTYTGGLGSNFDKLTGNKTAKNNLVVANAKTTFLPSGSILIQISSSSSQGPTDDFRIKPDIAGRGGVNNVLTEFGILSAIDTNDSAYDYFSGTSMASPNVAGSLLLLQQYYNQLNSNYMRAATLKGLACHTTLDDSRIGPDPVFGWGFLDVEAAANVIKNDNDGNALIIESSLSDSDTYTYQFTAGSGSELRATICWTDPAGTTSSSPSNVLTPRLVNDLDLRLEDSGATVFTPWKLDNTNVAASAIKGDNDVDNIERIDISNPVAGNYTLTVTHKGTLTNGSQAFSLILTGANLTLSTATNNVSEVRIWPNPVEDRLNLDLFKLSGKVDIIIYDVNGRKVYQEKSLSDKEHYINTNRFTSGIYFMTIKNKNQKNYKKIIIK